MKTAILFSKVPSFLCLLATGVSLSLTSPGHSQVLIEFLQQPSNAVLHPCGEVTFGVVARATENGMEISPLTYQWQHQPLGAEDWTDIVGETHASYRPEDLWATAPRRFRCAVTAREQVAVSAAALLTLDTNCFRPTIVSAIGIASQNAIIVRFNEAMDPITAVDTFNYRAGSELHAFAIEAFLGDPFTVVLKFRPIDLVLRVGETNQLGVNLVAAAGGNNCACRYIIDTTVDFVTEPGLEIEILQQPKDATVLLGRVATLSANARATSSGMAVPVQYQWQRYVSDAGNWFNIEGATNATYSTSITNCSSVPLYFRCRFQADYTFDFSQMASLMVAVDCLPPFVVSTFGDVRQNVVVVQFSDPLDPESALDPFNYEFVSGPDPAFPAIDTAYLTNTSTVVLVLSSSTPLRAGRTYKLSISGVGDLGDPACGCKFMFPETVTFPGVLECLRITEQPASRVVFENCQTRFEIGVRWLDGPPHLLDYQWLKNGTNIPGATNRSYTTETLTQSDNGAAFSAVVRSACQVITSKVATLTIVLDSFSPVLSAAHSGEAADTVVLDFLTSCAIPGGGLDPTRASDSFNYSISGGEVLGAALDCNGTRVHLITSPQVPGNTYTVTVFNLLDRSGNEIVGGITNATFVAPNRTPVPPQTLRLVSEGDQAVLEWANGGMLQFSDSPTGPWVDAADQASPAFVPVPFACRGETLVPKKFYRVRWSPP